MRNSATLVFLGFLCACSSNGGNNAQNSASPAASPAASVRQTAGTNAVVLHPSRLTYKSAAAACAGTLGSITFSMGHARAHAAAGIDLKEQPDTPSAVMRMTFSDKANGKSATVIVNGHDRSVNGKHVIAKMNQSVACIQPD